MTPLYLCSPLECYINEGLLSSTTFKSQSMLCISDLGIQDVRSIIVGSHIKDTTKNVLYKDAEFEYRSHNVQNSALKSKVVLAGK